MRVHSAGRKIYGSLFSVRRYIIFFLLISFVVTISFLLFWHRLSIAVWDVRSSAVVTFGNILFLSLLFTVLDGIRQRYHGGASYQANFAGHAAAYPGGFLCAHSTVAWFGAHERI